MSGVNKCTFVGHVGKAESRETGSGNSVLNFSLAVNEKWTDQNSGEKKERTEWIPCALFGKRAKSLEQYITKGKQLYIEGKWQTRSWEKDGVKRFSTECIVQDVQLLGGGNGAGKRERQDGEHQHGSGGGQEDHSYDGQSTDEIPFAVNVTNTQEAETIGEAWNASRSRLI